MGGKKPSSGLRDGSRSRLALTICDLYAVGVFAIRQNPLLIGDFPFKLGQLPDSNDCFVMQ
jgi:hypothetical protein